MSRVILAGGGLANGLIALRLLGERPDLELLMIEREPRAGGQHVWCFHETDVSPAQREWLAPLVECSWSTHEVRFPAFAKTIPAAYHAVTSDRLHEALAHALGDRLVTGANIVEVTPTQVTLEDGRSLAGDVVIDGRGHPATEALSFAWQKFTGLWLTLEAPHGLERPILMDATVSQVDGYRFLYTLPFGPRRLLVEDTRYSDSPSLDRPAMRQCIHAYAAAMGWRIAAIEGEEHGVLPIALSGDIAAFWDERAPGVPCSGMSAALFHPTTGYSLPAAAQLADALAAERAWSPSRLHALVRARSIEAWRRGSFFRALNRMLFHAAEPSRRWVVFERFYRLPAPLIARFYAGRLKLADRLRIVAGRPPVPLARALGCLFEPRTARPLPGAARHTRGGA